MLAEPDVDLLERFGSDTVMIRGIAGSFGLKRSDWKPFPLTGGATCLVPGTFNPVKDSDGSWLVRRNGVDLARMPAGGYYFDMLTKHPGAEHPDLATWECWTYTDEYFEALACEAEVLYRETDKALVM